MRLKFDIFNEKMAIKIGEKILIQFGEDLII